MTEEKPEETEGSARPQDENADFAARLKAARTEAGLDAAPEPEPPAGVAAYALRLATELISGVIVGGALGWWVDKALGTSPFGIIFFFMFGFIVGMWNVVRAVKKMNELNAGAGPAPAIPERETGDDE